MDFFARQDQARRRTQLLVIYFVTAVVLIVLALNLIAAGVLAANAHYNVYQLTLRQIQEAQGAAPRQQMWRADIFFYVTAATLIVIIGGNLYKISQLSAGGRAVAQLMGAVPVLPNTSDPHQRILRNVVEEMSIASGVPVPAIYVLPGESRINAFAAGFSPRDAVICVTQGSLTNLDRDELQGVVAHEFSHILNGDMRLDLRLVGVLYGILVIGLIGYGLLRVGMSDSGRDRDRNFSIQIAIALVGLGVMAVGFIGLFFGRLIQAAVCRQRELLADAAAVQFTRNPNGLAGALKKIGAASFGSRVDDHTAEQIAHMFFASSMGAEWGWMATHPPIAQRIRAIDPTWDGKFPPRRGPTLVERYGGWVQPDRAVLAQRLPVSAAGIVASLGSPMPRHVAWASDFLTSIPPTIDHAAREPFGARALVFALLLSDEPSVRDKQLAVLSASTDQATLQVMNALHEPVAQLGPRARRVLLDLALPALRHLSPDQCRQFAQTVAALIDADSRVSLFEYMLRTILAKNLLGGSAPRPQAMYYALKPLVPDAQLVLSALAQADEKDPAAIEAAFNAGAARLEADQPLTLQASVSVQALDEALSHLSQAAPGVKRRVVDACAYCVAADGMVQTEEGELLRAITTALDCPLPPLLAEHAVVTQAV